MSLLKRITNKINRRFFDFQPYKKKLEIEGINAEFFYGTQQAQEWYDPLKPYALLEYEWVLKNVKLEGQNIIDCGAHHGQYSVVFGKGAKGNCNLIAVDPMPMNCVLTEVNLALNSLRGRIEQCAITTHEGEVRFSNQSNGFISKSGNMTVKGIKLSKLMPYANVVKLDIEGHEFEMLEQALEEMSKVHTWIIEVHPERGNPDILVAWLTEKNYKIKWVNREKNVVEPYEPGTIWKIHSTIFATKESRSSRNPNESRGRGNQQHPRRNQGEGHQRPPRRNRQEEEGGGENIKRHKHHPQSLPKQDDNNDNRNRSDNPDQEGRRPSNPRNYNRNRNRRPKPPEDNG